MLTQSTDYDFMAPSADEINGEIIPVADVAERTPTIRREDAYHLLETEWDFLHNTTTPSIRTLSGVGLYARFYNLFNDLSSFREVQRSFTPYTFKNLRFTNLLQAVASNVYNTNTTDVSEFFGWIAQNYPSYILACPQLPSTNPFSQRKPFDADILRMMYWLMNQPSYEVFREMANTYNPTLYRYSVVAGNTYDVKTISYDSSEGIVETTRTFHIVGNGCVEGRENPTSGSYYTSLGGVLSCSKYENGTRQYIRKNTLPQSDVYAEIEFNSALNISAAFIVYTLYCWYGNSDSFNYCKKKFWLEPLTHTTGSKWKFKLYDVAKARELVDLTGVPWEGDSSWGSRGATCSLSYAAGYQVLAMVEGKKYKLPTGWNWSPS